MGENGHETSLVNGSSMNGETNGYSDSTKTERGSSSKHKHKRKETEEERRLRKEKEREERHKKTGRRDETEEERRIRKEKERKEREERHKREGRRDETEEERRIRKEKERKEREERHKREGRRDETDEERRIRKERERKEKEQRHKIKEEEQEEEMDDEEEEKEGGGGGEESMEEEQQGEGMDVDIKDEPYQEESEEEEKVKKRKKDKDEDFVCESDEDDVPLSRKKKPKKEEDEDFQMSTSSTTRKSSKKSSAKTKKEVKTSSSSPTKTGRKKKEEDEAHVWKWWEEEKVDDGTKWKFLEHKGPLFAPAYEPLPKGVNFYYDGKKVKLSQDAEEVAGFYGRMIDHDYTTKEVFNRNFFKDWRKVMTDEERKLITHLNKCDFSEIDVYYKKCSEERKNRSKEEKKAEKDKNAAIQEEYGFCLIDNHREKIGNFRIEPPGLFRGRGEHPKQGMLKKRVLPEDVIINCSKDSKIPDPPKGHKWKEVRHDNTVTWLASWTENIQNQIKYVMLNPSSKLKGEKDMMKYEKARELKKKIAKIREDYTMDFKSKEMRIRQRSVALYFIDKLALRAGNEKDEDQADTVGCCSLRVEHITLHPEKDGKEYCVEFDFLGKDSIRYHNIVQVEKRVFKNLQLFMENKKGSDDLFDRLNTSILNEYLNTLMKGLTAKVFRTYNASFTLQEQLNELTDEDDNIPAKMLSYNRANRKVAVLCNHQRAAPKTHDQSMQNLQNKIEAKREMVEKAEKEFKSAKKAYKNGGSTTEKVNMDKKKKAVERAMEQLNKLETQAVDKEENKTIALGTSKLNYLDPRISVAWCKKYDVPIEKVYNKTQRDKFRWAIDMAGPDYVF